MDLFAADDASATVTRPARPLAVRMRPRTLDEVVGQGHLLAAGSPLRQLVEPNGNTTVGSSSVILWGPPGTGKTTIASIVAGAEGRHFTELSAVTAGVKDVRAVVEEARHRLAMTGKETVLFIDEVHRFTTAQQDALLPSVENRWVTLIAATTENPSFSVNAPLLSRSLLVTLQPLGDDDVKELIGRAVSDERGLAGTVVVAEDAVAQIVRLAGGDGRRALTLLEAAAGAAEAPSGAETTPVVTEAAVARAADAATVRYDRAGDQHYDVISAFIKSIRGSDVDAALHYLARMIAAGEDPRFISRRLIVSASEDIGMADPSALQTAVAAAQAVALIGMPEGRIVLAEAVVHLATAPKSNAVIVGIDSALADVRSGQIGVVPAHLRDAHYAGAKGLGHGKGYRYPHDEATGVSQQQYLPDVLAGRSYYRPTQHGFERAVTQRWERIRALLAGRRVPDSDDRRSTGGAVE